MLRNRCWLATFHIIIVGDADRWCHKWLVWSSPHRNYTNLSLSSMLKCIAMGCAVGVHPMLEVALVVRVRWIEAWVEVQPLQVSPSHLLLHTLHFNFRRWCLGRLLGIINQDSSISKSKGHFTHEARAMTMKLWEPKRKRPEVVPRHLQNHVVWSRILKCSVKSHVTGPSTKCYFNEFLFTRVLTHDKIE
jgi:hypothetical protein